MPTSPSRLPFLLVCTVAFATLAHFALAAEENAQAGKTYTLGSIVKFDMSGEAEKFKVSGWTMPAKEFTWTEGKSAKLSISLPGNENPLTLRMKLVGLVHAPEVANQPVEVYVNGEKVADWQVATPANFSAKIPQKIAATKQLEIELRTPKATTPKALNMNDDIRVLGVGCYEIQITKE